MQFKKYKNLKVKYSIDWHSWLLIGVEAGILYLVSVFGFSYLIYPSGQTHLNFPFVNFTASVPFIRFGSPIHFNLNPRAQRRRHFLPEFSPLQRIVGRLHSPEWSFRRFDEQMPLASWSGFFGTFGDTPQTSGFRPEWV